MATKAKYMRVYDWLKDKIQNGTFKVGDRLPNEVELAERFHVHRMTVRQAINKLVSDHMVVRKRGHGTFLISDKHPIMIKSLDNLTTYRDDIIGAGLQPKYKLLEFKRGSADAANAARLQLEVGAPVITFSRLMYASDIPLLVEHTALPADIFSSIDSIDLEEPLYSLMQEKFQLKMLYTENEIGCIMPDTKERKLLQIPEGAPCLSLYLVCRDSSGRVVEFSQSLHRGDKYRFKCTIQQYILNDFIVA